MALSIDTEDGPVCRIFCMQETGDGASDEALWGEACGEDGGSCECKAVVLFFFPSGEMCAIRCLPRLLPRDSLSAGTLKVREGEDTDEQPGRIAISFFGVGILREVAESSPTCCGLPTGPGIRGRKPLSVAANIAVMPVRSLMASATNEMLADDFRVCFLSALELSISSGSTPSLVMGAGLRDYWRLTCVACRKSGKSRGSGISGASSASVADQVRGEQLLGEGRTDHSTIR